MEYKGYYCNGSIHRINGPAFIEYYENGNICNEEYFINGKRHREDGPANI
jgi:antitoxin component YwqK of YwqJK toxin-antitoxin module